MRKQPLPLDPFSRTCIGVAIWVTDLLVSRKIAQAIKEQNTLLTRTMRGRPLTRTAQINRKAWSREGPAPDRAGTAVRAAPLK